MLSPTPDNVYGKLHPSIACDLPHLGLTCFFGICISDHNDNDYHHDDDNNNLHIIIIVTLVAPALDCPNHCLFTNAYTRAWFTGFAAESVSHCHPDGLSPTAFIGGAWSQSPEWEKMLQKLFIIIIRSTSKSRPNNIRGGKMSVSLYVRPSTKSFFDFNEIWYIGRGR